MVIPEIEEGDILEGPFWNEPVRVITTDKVGRGVKIYAVGTVTQENYSQILSEEQLSSGVEITKKEEGPDFDGSPRRFREAVEAARIDLASEYDSHHALSTSQVDPVPHQLEAVYKYMLPENFADNRVTFFLADDAGAGKTIMAGLLLKELKHRGIVENCLILAPAKLQRQWQKELLRLFDEEYRIIDRSDMGRAVGNPWRDNKFCITSMAFAIQPDVKDSLRDMQWDMVVADEAHHLSAYRYGSDQEEDKTERYKIGELLRENSLHRLLLSATPHKGRRDHFQLLLRLLDNDLFAEEALPREIVHSDDPGTVFLRRMKEDMMDLHGNELFNERSVHTVSYQISGDELQFYKDVTRYVEDQFQSAWKKENRHVQFALIILQRRVASSIRAAKESLRRRKEGLQELLEDVDKLREAQEVETPDPETLEEMVERQRWEIEEEALRRLTMSANREQLKYEIDTLKDLVHQAEALEKAGVERKLRELRQLLKGEREETPFSSDEKMVIFTEAKDTLDLLTENLESWGYDYVTIHGNMEMGQTKNPGEGTRLWTEEQFNDPDGPQILVATDAAGEGINLHKECRLMVNYDIPWNPTRLEQRMGRIHRYGQEDPVHIYNLVASNTREGYVLEKLSIKLEQMKQDIGSDRVFDVISELSEEVRLDKLIRDVVSGSADTDAADMRLESLDEKGEAAVERATQQGLATRHINLSQVQEWLRRDKERRLTPEYIEKFFVSGFQLLGGAIEKRQDGFWRIEWVPAEIRRAANEAQFGEPDQKYTKFTFYKEETDEYEEAEFVAPGHPLFEAVKLKVEQEFSTDLTQGSTFVDPDATEPYILWFIRQELQDGNRESVGERVFCLKHVGDGAFQRVNEAVLHDLKPVEDEVDQARIQQVAEQHGPKEDALDWLYDNVATEYQEEVEEEKQDVIETIRPSMKKALNSAIVDLREDIRELEKKAEQEGADMERAIDNKKRKRNNLIQRRDEQLKRLERATQIFPVDPVEVGSAVVLPPQDEDERVEQGGMSRDEEVEEIGMRVAMDHEREHCREPEDVAEENLGFDVRSVDKDETGVQEWRYIEVKGRAGEGAVALTENEWTMARRLGDEFWLYIVTNTKTGDPDLHIIRDPASKLDPDERTVVRYFVDQDDWQTETMGGTQ